MNFQPRLSVSRTSSCGALHRDSVEHAHAHNTPNSHEDSPMPGVIKLRYIDVIKSCHCIKLKSYI